MKNKALRANDPRFSVLAIKFSLAALGFIIIFIPAGISSSDLRPRIEIEKIGIIADIHAASKKTRESSNPYSLIRPVEYPEVLTETLEKMKQEGANIVVSLGDNTNDSSEKHALILKGIMEKEEVESIWVKGNHDSDGRLEGKINIMETLGAPGRYYYLDKEDWRIIVLDSSEAPGEVFYQGGISEDQFEWLKSALVTNKDVLITIHHPIFDKETQTSVYPVYEKLEKLLSESGRVRYVLSGHWHAFYWQKEYNGIWYFGIPALTLEGEKGFYKIINLPSFYYDSYEPV